MKPILLDWPDTIETPRLIIRVPQAGGGAQLNAAIAESIDELRPWMPWAQTCSLRFCRSYPDDLSQMRVHDGRL